jgi:hypothetical protein
MTVLHPLDRPVWSTLSGRQANLSIVQGGARRLDPSYGIFAAVADESPACLADLAQLVLATGDLAIVEGSEPPPIAGVTVTSSALCWQMIAEGAVKPAPADLGFEPLTEADAPQMLALATLTRPGAVLLAHSSVGRLHRGEAGRPPGGHGRGADEARWVH